MFHNIAISEENVNEALMAGFAGEKRLILLIESDEIRYLMRSRLVNLIVEKRVLILNSASLGTFIPQKYALC